MPLAARLFSRVLPHPVTGCWNWLGTATPEGYGKILIDRKAIGTHRFLYLVFSGPIPIGHHIDHLCRNPRCCNPAHLEAVTPSVNSLRGDNVNSRKTTCPRGHAYDTGGNGKKRGCKTCERARHLRRRIRLREIRAAAPGRCVREEER